MTGWGAGYCAGGRPGYAGNRFGWGGTRQWGRGGLGRRYRFYATEQTGWQPTGASRPGRRWPHSPAADTNDEGLRDLTTQIAELAEALTTMRRKIETLEAENKRS